MFIRSISVHTIEPVTARQLQEIPLTPCILRSTVFLHIPAIRYLIMAKSFWRRSGGSCGYLHFFVPLDLRIYSPVKKSAETFPVGGCMGFYRIPAFWGNNKLYSSFRFHVLPLSAFLRRSLFRHKSIPPLLYYIIPRNDIYMKIHCVQIFMKIFVHSANCIFMKILYNS